MIKQLSLNIILPLNYIICTKFQIEINGVKMTTQKRQPGENYRAEDTLEYLITKHWNIFFTRKYLATVGLHISYSGFIKLGSLVPIMYK